MTQDAECRQTNTMIALCLSGVRITQDAVRMFIPTPNCWKYRGVMESYLVTQLSGLQNIRNTAEHEAMKEDDARRRHLEKCRATPERMVGIDRGTTGQGPGREGQVGR